MSRGPTLGNVFLSTVNTVHENIVSPQSYVLVSYTSYVSSGATVLVRNVGIGSSTDVPAV